MGSIIIELAENARTANRREMARTPRRPMTNVASPLNRDDVN